jgi:hypothetical protein
VPESTRRQFDELQSDISERVRKQLMSPRTLLGGMRLIDESSRLSSQYQDPNYLPFYFHVGRVLDPKRVVCVGLDLGLQVSCLLKGCSGPESSFCVQPPSEGFYSPRLALSNVKSVAGRRFPIEAYSGRPHDHRPQEVARIGFDMAIVTRPTTSDDLMESMDFCWKGLVQGGAMVVDHLSHGESDEVFKDFCLGRSASHHVFKTRYSTGMVIR